MLGQCSTQKQHSKYSGQEHTPFSQLGTTVLVSFYLIKASFFFFHSLQREKLWSQNTAHPKIFSFHNPGSPSILLLLILHTSFLAKNQICTKRLSQLCRTMFDIFQFADTHFSILKF